MKLNKKSTAMLVFLSVIFFLVITIVVFINQPQFGRTPRGERLERVKESPNYRDGQFRNLSETPQITSDRGFVGTMIDFLFRSSKSSRPAKELPVIKTDLWKLDRKEDVLVWFGHSSYLIQIDGKRVLVDPVFCMAAPVSFVNKPFKETYVYGPEDIPDIDYLVISHDHWDHLDYETVMNLRERTGKVVCGLGVGEHFEYWGFEKNRIVEMDWNEDAVLDDNFTVYCLPARHFSGRSVSPNRSLWASFLIQTPTQTIYISGDGGYDKHFAEIGARFSDIDMAILENGQYDAGWKYIHLLPEDLVKAAVDLNAKKLLTVHNSRYALGKHSWKEPMEKISTADKKDSLHLIAPLIGEIVNLKDSVHHPVVKWWETLD